jgi:hypothetical protein
LGFRLSCKARFNLGWQFAPTIFWPFGIVLIATVRICALSPERLIVACSTSSESDTIIFAIASISLLALALANSFCAWVRTSAVSSARGCGNFPAKIALF